MEAGEGDALVDPSEGAEGKTVRWLWGRTESRTLGEALGYGLAACQGACCLLA